MTSIDSLSYRYLNNANPIADSDSNWRIFIQDHKANILSNSTKFTVTIDDIVPYEYRPEDYLQDVVKTNPQITWIFMFINNLSDKLKFNRSLSTVYIPNFDYLSELRATYLAVVAAGVKRSA